MKFSEIKFSQFNRIEILDRIFNDWIYRGNPEVITVLDASSIVRADRDIFYSEYMSKRVNVFADGYYVYAASKLLGIYVPEQVTGYDLATEILSMAESKGGKIFFLGASREVLDGLILNVENNYSDKIIGGANDGYYNEENIDQLIADINNTKSNILMVGMGYPRREKFIEYAESRVNLGVIIGVGGVFDILGGKTSRAPKFMVRIKLEWLYRFFLEPKRMFTRVVGDYPYFVLKVFRELFDKKRKFN